MIYFSLDLQFVTTNLKLANKNKDFSYSVESKQQHHKNFWLGSFSCLQKALPHTCSMFINQS